MTISEWLNRAVRRLPHKERMAVRQELMDHFLDRVQALETGNHSHIEVEDLALKAMGDPEETCRLLVRVHKPWLSWLLWGLRLSLAAVLLVALLNLPQLRAGIQQQKNLSDWLALEEGRREFPETPLQARRIGACQDSFSLGVFRVSVHSARNEVRRNVFVEANYNGYYEERILDVVLRFEAPPWRTPEKGALLKALLVTDDRGREYRPLPEEAREALTGFYSLNYMGKDLTGSYYQVCILREPDAEELELDFRQGSEAHSLRVRFGPWEFPEGVLQGALEREEDATEALLALPLRPPEDVARLEPIRTGAGDAASLGGFQASVPWVQRYRCLDETGQPTENPELLELVLLLRGPAEALPQSHRALFSRLSVTGGDGTPYPLEDPWEKGSLLVSYAPQRWENAVAYRLQLPAWYGGKAESLTLTYESQGGPITLTLRTKEETP